MPRKHLSVFNLPAKTRKHVTCYCPVCLGRKQVDPRTKKNHESRSRPLPGSSVDSRHKRHRRHQSDSNLSNVSAQEQSSSWETDDSTERINNESDIDFVD